MAAKGLGRLRAAFERRRLEKELISNATPTRVVALSQFLLDNGDLDDALDVAEKGLQLFPDSPEITYLRERCNDAIRRNQIAELRRQLDTATSPTVYAELARLENEAGDSAGALETCDGGLRRFPNCADLYVRMAQVRIARFRRDMLARDGIRALHELETALGIDRGSAPAMLTLAELLLHLGCTRRAKEILDRLSRMYLRDERVVSLLDATAGLPREDKDPEEACRQVEENRRFAVELPGQRFVSRARAAAELVIPPNMTADSLAENLADFPGFDGFMGVVLIDAGGKLLASKMSSELDPGKVAASARALQAAANNGSLRMDTGRFREGQIEGSEGNLHLAVLDGTLLAICHRSTKANASSAALRQFLDTLGAPRSPEPQQ